MENSMSDIADKVNRIGGLQQGLSEYLPLLLRRFEGIEDRLQADLKSTRQELKETRKDIEAKLNDTRKEARSRSRTIIISVLGTGLAIAASIYFT